MIIPAPDTQIIEDILVQAARWMSESGQHQWNEDAVLWKTVSTYHKQSDFYIAYADNTPAACMALVERDPAFWPDAKQGEALYIHKLAVVRQFAGKGFAQKMVASAKQQALQKGIAYLRLDCHQDRPKVHQLYQREGFVFVRNQTYFGTYHASLFECRLP